MEGAVQKRGQPKVTGRLLPISRSKMDFSAFTSGPTKRKADQNDQDRKRRREREAGTCVSDVSSRLFEEFGPPKIRRLVLCGSPPGLVSRVPLFLGSNQRPGSLWRACCRTRYPAGFFPPGLPTGRSMTSRSFRTLRKTDTSASSPADGAASTIPTGKFSPWSAHPVFAFASHTDSRSPFGTRQTFALPLSMFFRN